MDKIYSRPRIKILKINSSKINKLKIRKTYFTILLLIISLLTGYRIMKSIDPIFEGLCTSKAKNIATDITNRKSSDVLNLYDYKNTVEIDEKNKILKTDIVTINKITSDIANAIQNELDELRKKTIQIPIGALIGNRYFAGLGPNIKINIISTGDVLTDIKTEFKTAGINQTVYRIYMEIECNVSILTSYKTIDTTIKNQVLLVETVLVGEVPETYLQLEQ